MWRGQGTKAKEEIEQVKVEVEVETKPRIASNEDWYGPLRSS
jgi:hypothetical protein